MTYTRTTSGEFTATGARHVTAQIAADLDRLGRCYGKPSHEQVERYRLELDTLLAGSHVAMAEYGFQRRGRRVLSLRYTFHADGTLSGNHPGEVPADIALGNAVWFSYMTWSRAWWRLAPGQRERISVSLPVRRVASTGPRDGNGIWHEDRSLGRHGARRGVFRPHDT